MVDFYGERTDLAMEESERFVTNDVEISGVSIDQRMDEKLNMQITTVKIQTKNGARVMKKPIGTYITLHIPELMVCDESDHIQIADRLARILFKLHPIADKGHHILVVGLGNRNVTPDALGPVVVDRLMITRHIVQGYGIHALDESGECITSALAPGVTGQTGMEAIEIVRGLVKEIKPDVIIVVDALAARSSRRLAKTIQIADVGIHPGSGVGNHRNELSEKTAGIPVIAIGVPTVMDAKGMFVIPKEIDAAIESIGSTIADAVNLYFKM